MERDPKMVLLEEMAEYAAEAGRKLNLYAQAVDRLKLGGPSAFLLGSQLTMASQNATKAAKEAVLLLPAIKVPARPR